MRKLILLLFSVFAVFSVSAVCAESKNVISTSLSDEQLQHLISDANWKQDPPHNIEKIENGNIYFLTTKDLMRFLLPLDLFSEESTPLLPDDRITGIIVDGKSFSKCKLVYMYVAILGTYYSTSTKGKIIIGNNSDDETQIAVYAYTNKSAKVNSQVNLFSCSYVFLPQSISAETWNYDGYAVCAVLIPNSIPYDIKYDVGYGGCKFDALYHYGTTISKLVIYTEQGARIYINGIYVGNTDETGKLTIEKPAGMYNIKIVFKNGITVEKTLEVQPNINNTLKIDYRTVNIKVVDGLSGEVLDDVQVSGNISENIDGTFTTNMPYGEYTLEFSKDGYWSENKTIEVDGDRNITIKLYPTSTIYKISTVPDLINTFPNSEFEVNLNLEPVRYVYGGMLYLDGAEILDIRDSNGVKLDLQNGGYCLGDFNSEKVIKIKFKTDDIVGDKAIQVRVKGNDELGNEYVGDYQIKYTVLDLPISLVVPSKWVIGENELRISELKGKDRIIFIQLFDNGSNLVYSDSYAFNAYESHTFKIPIQNEGNYKLVVSSSDFKTNLDVEVTNPIEIAGNTISVPAGESGYVSLKIYNPYIEPQYYKIEVIGDCLENKTVQEVSVAPGITKTFEIPIKIVENPQFDSYKLTVKVLDSEGISVEYEGDVICNIGEDSSGFILGMDDDLEFFGIPAMYIGAGVLLLVGGFFVWRWFL